MWAILVVRAIRFAILVHPTASLSSVCRRWQWLDLNFDVWKNKAFSISPPSPWVRLSVFSFSELESYHLFKESVNDPEHIVLFSLCVCWADGNPRCPGISAVPSCCAQLPGWPRGSCCKLCVPTWSIQKTCVGPEGEGETGANAWWSCIHELTFSI